MGFWSDQFRDSADGKYSSKKFWGFIIMLLVCVTFVLDGIAFYNANENLFNAMLIAGCTLLGLRAVSAVFKKNDVPK
jgi:uncharacterized membrane protein YhaH (DUF805 family)